MSDVVRQQDPSMEEILNSIRRIVAEDAKQRSKRAETPVEGGTDNSSVLDLTEVVTADGSVFSIADQQEARAPEAAAGEKQKTGEGGSASPREQAATKAVEAWVAVQGAWTRAFGLETELRQRLREAASTGSRDGVLDRLSREQENLTRRLVLIGAMRDGVLAGVRLVGALGEMVARDVGLPSCDLGAVAATLHDPPEEASGSPLESVSGGWERVQSARAALLSSEQRLAAAEKAWSTRRAGATGPTDPLQLLEAEHEHLLARSAVVAAQREEIVASHSLAVAVQKLAEHPLPG